LGQFLLNPLHKKKQSIKRVKYRFQNSCSFLDEFLQLAFIWAIKPKGNNMTCYETLFVVKPTLTDEETTAQIAKIKEIVANNGGELVATNDMGMRKLAYPVEKNDRGYYTVLFYKAEGTLINELERNLKISEDVIKFLTVKYVKQKELTQFNKLVEAANKKAEPAAEAAPVVEEAAPAAESTEA
jgi:small subunit ribosomal protein S6